MAYVDFKSTAIGRRSAASGPVTRDLLARIVEAVLTEYPLGAPKSKGVFTLDPNFTEEEAVQEVQELAEYFGLEITEDDAFAMVKGEYTTTPSEGS